MMISEDLFEPGSTQSLPLATFQPDAKAKYQPWYEESFTADLRVQRLLKPIERWMYRALLQQAWVCSARPHLPNDDDELWMMAGCESKKQWMRHREAVAGMFQKGAISGLSVLMHPKLAEEWQRNLDIRQSKAKAGQASGLKRRRVSSEIGSRQQTDVNTCSAEVSIRQQVREGKEEREGRKRREEKQGSSTGNEPTTTTNAPDPIDRKKPVTVLTRERLKTEIQRIALHEMEGRSLRGCDVEKAGDILLKGPYTLRAFEYALEEAWSKRSRTRPDGDDRFGQNFVHDDLEARLPQAAEDAESEDAVSERSRRASALLTELRNSYPAIFPPGLRSQRTSSRMADILYIASEDDVRRTCSQLLEEVGSDMQAIDADLEELILSRLEKA